MGGDRSEVTRSAHTKPAELESNTVLLIIAKHGPAPPVITQCHQLRTGSGTQWDPGTPIYRQEKSDQKWSSWKSCSQKAIPLMWEQGQVIKAKDKVSTCFTECNNMKFTPFSHK